eukprot:TRINITY_DN9799_c0_g1_i1.p5 TRINITY_DN9799_c0_g1~~TRINITY_DN9799_c0_g1_i1.p5  ORF type:complete len:112 (-),score=1.89 TRINITY_DN9799_c0_g1_i1:64-399(-)
MYFVLFVAFCLDVLSSSQKFHWNNFFQQGMVGQCFGCENSLFERVNIIICVSNFQFGILCYQFLLLGFEFREFVAKREVCFCQVLVRLYQNFAFRGKWCGNNKVQGIVGLQ